MALKETIYVELEGVKHPINLGVNSSALYCDLRDCGLFDYYRDIIKLIDVGANPGIIRDVLYTAIVDGYRVEKKRVPEGFTNFTVGDTMDTMPKNDLLKFVDALTKSLPKPEESEEAKTEKKKDPKKKA